MAVSPLLLPQIALKFAGGTNRIEVPDATSIQTLPAWSWLLAINSTTVTSGATLARKGTNVQRFDLSDALGNIRIIVARATTSSSYTTTSTPVAVPNRWYLVGGTFDISASPTTHFYVGDLDTPMTEAATTGSDGSGAQTSDAAANLGLGGRAGGSGSGFVGYIGPSLVHNRALSIADFREMQASGLRYMPLGCVGLWVPGRLGTSTVLDESGNKNTGTVTGAVVGIGAPWRAPRTVFAPPPSSGTTLTANAAGQAVTTLTANVRRGLSTAIAGVANTIATLHAIRALSATAAGQATTTTTLNARRQLTLSASGLATVVAAMNVKRLLATSAAGQASVTLVLTKRGQSATTATGQATVSLTMNVRRSITATVAGTSTTSLSPQKWRNLTTSAGGQAGVSLSVNAKRSLSVAASGVSAINIVANARRLLSVSASGQASVSAIPTTPTATTVVAAGKYKPEHDSALIDVGNATGFSVEHASALRDIADAGV